MFFKRLEMLGFKSFADKTTLIFEPGVTAVVGPNGCGKSNIFDAIRWVLGEQSIKALRATSMEDVIFNGTDSKAGLGFAEVSLTFTNEAKFLPIEYDEVTVTRRLFRSGESEYLLNKTPVRLKDITELFMGTGVGAESYSLVEQGKIDLILSSRPEDRRLIFDEAAGITKYKSKKKEALNKLQDTENNLLRINDIILEVKRQIGSIERQANKARRYQEEFEKLKNLEIKLASYELAQLREQNESLNKRVQEKKEAQNKLVSLVGQSQTQLQEFNLLFKMCDAKITEFKTESIKLDSSIEMNVRHIRLNKERIDETIGIKKRLSEQRHLIEDRINKDKEKIDNYKKESCAICDNITLNTSLIKQEQLKLETIAKTIKQLQDEITDAQKKTLDLTASKAKLKNQEVDNFTQVQGLLARKRRLELEKTKVIQEKQEVDASLKSIDSQINNFTNNLNRLNSNKTQLNNELQAYQSKIDEVNSNITNCEKGRIALESQRDFIQQLKLQYEDIAHPIKAVLISPEAPSGNNSGILGKVNKVLAIDKKSQDLLSNLAPDLAKINNFKQIICEAKFIDLDSQRINNNLEEITKSITKLKESLQLLDSQSQSLKLRLQQVEDELHQEEIAISNEKTKRNAIFEQSSKLEEELQLITTELEDTNNSVDELKKKEEQFEKEIASYEESLTNIKELINKNQESITQNLKEKEASNIYLAQNETQLHSLEDKEESLKENLKIFEDSLKRNLEELSVLEKEGQELMIKSKCLEEEIAQLEAQNKSHREKKDLLLISLKDYDKNQAQTAKQIEEQQNNLNELDEKLEELKADIHNFQMQLQEALFQEKSLKERTLQSYKINLEDNQINLDESFNIDETNTQIAKLKEKLESFGTVNLVAIEEYEELKQRFDFLTQQQNDLLKAKEDLHKTITKINSTTRQLFLDTFNKVGEEFRSYFRTLFGGGEAQLILIDQSDVLESGIEIVARPPGKKLQSISLLSGGEKALSAIAIIFGIFKVKPSPFCVLDEIDAALDESNVERFAYLLKDFTKVSQFILITHNKKTIVNADIMYGITMQETGISKIVSAKLRDEKKEEEVLVGSV